MTLDSLDIEIIRLLQTDGRMSFRDLSEKLDKPESTIRNRYNTMVEQDYFKIVALTNPEKLGIGTMAIIGLKVEPKYLETVASAISEVQDVRFIAYMAGKYDLLLEVYTSSNESLMNFINGTLSKMEGIREQDLSIELKLYKEAFNWLHYIDNN